MRRTKTTTTTAHATARKKRKETVSSVRRRIREEDVMQTQQWVEDELSKLRMEGIAISSLPLIEVEEKGARADVLRKEKDPKKKSNITDASKRVHKLWIDGEWEGIGRDSLEKAVALLSTSKRSRNVRGVVDILTNQLGVPLKRADADVVASFILQSDSSDADERKNGEGIEGGSDNDDCAERLARWCEEWTTSSAVTDASFRVRDVSDQSSNVTDYCFTPWDGNLTLSVSEARRSVCPSTTEISSTHQVELLKKLGLCGRSLAPSLPASQFLTEWFTSEGMSKIAMLTASQSSRCVSAMWERIVKSVNASEASAAVGRPPSVYLGGVDGRWRDKEAIPLLRTMDISFTDPTLFRELPDRVALDLTARARARVLLFVLDSESPSSLALVVAAAAQIASGRRVSVVVLDSSDSKATSTTASSTKCEWRRAVGYLAAVAHCYGVKVFSRIKAGVFDAVRLIEESKDSSATADASAGHSVLAIEDDVVSSATRAVDARLESLDAKGTETSTKLDKLEQLRMENAMLKTELGAIDEDFFADIEDLKFRYARAVREIDRMEKELRVARRDNEVNRKRHEDIWDAMSKQLYAADTDQSGCLPSRDFRRIACRHLQLRKEEAHKVMQSLPSDVFGCVNYVAFLKLGHILHGVDTSRRRRDGLADDEDDKALPTLAEIEMKLERSYAAGLWKGLTRQQVMQTVGQTPGRAPSEHVPAAVLRRGLRRLVDIANMPIDVAEQDGIVQGLIVPHAVDEGDWVSVRRWLQMCKIWPFQKTSGSRRRKRVPNSSKRSVLHPSKTK